jgi:hypothetical protein
MDRPPDETRWPTQDLVVAVGLNPWGEFRARIGGQDWDRDWRPEELEN